jgi:hypothetical protein
VLFLLTKISAIRRIIDCFGELKGFIRKCKIDVAKRIFEMAALKRKKAFNNWRDLNDNSNPIRAIQSKFVKKMLETQIGKIFNAIRIWNQNSKRRIIGGTTT